MTDFDACLNNKCYVGNFSYDQVYDIRSCIITVMPCYFRCMSVPADMQLNPDDVGRKIQELKTIGRAGAVSGIVASCLFILLSAYLGRYRRWIEQIILSKVVCDLFYGVVLLGQLNSRLLETAPVGNGTNISPDAALADAFGLEVVSSLGLIWIPVLFFEVKNVIISPFSGWDVSKLVARWVIAIIVSISWACLMLLVQFRRQVNMFQYSPIIYIGPTESKNGLNTYA
jgi:hypothetical protein